MNNLFFCYFSLHYCKPTALMINGICQTLKTKIPCLSKTVTYIQYMYQIHVKYFVLFGSTLKNICHIKRKMKLMLYICNKIWPERPFPYPHNKLGYFFISSHVTFQQISFLFSFLQWWELLILLCASELIWRVQLSTLPKPHRWMPYNCCHILDYHQDTFLW